MSDSFADLWNSSAPAKPAPQKLGAVTPNTTSAPRRQQYDAFAMLSSAGSSAPNSRPITPSLAGLAGKQPAPKPISKQASGGDAFSDLLGSSNPGNSTQMTIAQRAAQVERERREQMQKRLHEQQQQKKQGTGAGSAWEGLDNLVAPSSSSSSSRTSASASVVEDDWGFGTAVTSPASASQKQKTAPTPSSKSVIDDEDWGLADFASAPSSSSSVPASQPKSQPKSQAIWDLDEFASAPAASSHTSSPPMPLRRTDSPGDFDFGNREDGLLEDDSGDEGGEDDILGDLSKPVDAIPKRAAVQTLQQPAPSPHPSSAKPSSRSVSPPPHILGQIVEMGFSIQQARIALASTGTGLDVQAALETLLANGAGSSSPSTTPPPRQAPRRRDRELELERLRENPRERERVRERERERENPSPSASQLEQSNIQDQADRLLAQASEIGLSVFSKASSFWKEGKEKVQKAYEERTAATAGASTLNGSTRGGAKAMNGRPKWMQDVVAHDDDEEGEGWKAGGEGEGRIRYDDSPEASPRSAKAPPPSARAAPPSTVKREAPPAATPRVANLLADDEPKAYISPFRRGKPKPTSTSPAPSTPVPVAAPPPRAPSPIRRTLISASPSTIAQSTQYKSAGGEAYKLGQYPAAEAAYTSAIACLPAGHLLLVPLYNNRALARLKNGDYTGTIDDAGAALQIIGEGFHPARSAAVEKVEDGAGVDLGEGLVKALKRRAEAWEGRERWVDAGKDWEALAGKDWVRAGVRGEAVRGAGRCRRIVEAQSRPVQEAPKPKPTPKPKSAVARPPMRKGPTPPSQALTELRASTNAAEAEDAAKHELKDNVDTRLQTWKGGKETNIRALLSSLDMVLWPELGMPKVGLGEVVTPAQVKVRYMRAIGKVHPDKLNAGNSTLEQRMLANGVFGALNEAWNAFKQ